MSAPSTTVTAFFELSATGGSFFTLDDPVRGELDGATYTLAGVVGVPVDITDDVRNVSITRGSTSTLFSARTPPAGRWAVVLNNHDRRFDPTFIGSDFYGNIVPLRRVTIASNGLTQADGNIEDWNFSYQPDGQSLATMDGSDALATLAAMELAAFTATASELPGARIDAVLDRSEIAFTSNRDIDTGVSTLQGDSVNANTNALQYLQTVAVSDWGTVFAARDGRITFRDRHSNAGKTPILFDDAGAGIKFQAIELNYGTELLYNRVIIERTGGSAQTAQDATSQTSYRVRTLSQSGLLMSSDALALDLATYLVNVYKQPQLRVASLTVELAGLTASQQNSVLSLDLTSLVDVSWTPNQLGAPTYLVDESSNQLVTEGGDKLVSGERVASPIARSCVVEGIQHQIGPDSHTVTLHLGDASFTSSFILDDAEFGVLDDDVLAF